VHLPAGNTNATLVSFPRDSCPRRRVPRRCWQPPRALQVTAVDDALDLFAVLIATKLIGAAERASVQDRLRSLRG
jgi:hypothetical protein